MSLEYIRSNEDNQFQFKDSGQYTSILSGFVKIAQMLTTQYCLEQEKNNKVTSCRKLLEQLHVQFLTVGIATLMDWALRLNLYGCGITKKTTMDGYINWIEDIVIFQDIELSMTDFRKLIHQLVKQTRRILLHELLFVKDICDAELPTYSWTELKDNAAKDELSWYFVLDKCNRMLEQKR